MKKKYSILTHSLISYDRGEYMEIIKKTIPHSKHSWGHPTAIIMDIETTGLGYHNKIILIGVIVLFKNSNDIKFIQFFNDDGISENELLLHFIETTKEVNPDFWITFNGTAFDFSFINARLNQLSIPYQFSKLPNVDLLRIARSYKKSYALDKLSLKTLERYYNIPRTDTISGKESVELYNTYLHTKDVIIKQTVLTHNEDDILNIIPLFHLMHSHLKFETPIVVSFNGTKLYVSHLIFNNDSLSFKASYLFCNQNLPISIQRMYYQIISNEMHYEVKLATKTLSPELIILDTEKCFNFAFDQLSNDQKQMFIIHYRNTLYEDNLSTILSKLIFNQ